MRLFIISRKKMRFQDVEKELLSITDVHELNAMIRNLVIERARLISIDKDEFDRILSLYKQRYKTLTGRNDFYNLKKSKADVERIFEITRKEFIAKQLYGSELAANYILSIFPKNKWALAVKWYVEYIKERRNR